MSSTTSTYAFTKEDILRERVERGLSWRQVAINLDLKTPDQARKAWVALTGTPHNTTQTTARKPKGTGTAGPAGVNGKKKTLTPLWTQAHIDSLTDEELDKFQEEVVETITGRDITVERVLRSTTIPPETIHVRKVHKFTFEGEAETLTVWVGQAGKESKMRFFRVADIRVVA